MSIPDFIATYSVDQSPKEVYDAILDVRSWWTGDVEGSTRRIGDEFSYRYPGAHYSKQKITELIPNERVVWRVVDSYLDGNEDPSEWTGTELIFDVSEKSGKTEVRFAHQGLVPEFGCFDAVSNAWGFFISASLRRLITTGEGPTPPPWA
jgi:uncharacterized protein YndB with AHSA1/START domain